MRPSLARVPPLVTDLTTIPLTPPSSISTWTPSVSASLLILIFCSRASGRGGMLSASVLSSYRVSTVMDLALAPAPPMSLSVLGMAMVFLEGLTLTVSRVTELP